MLKTDVMGTIIESASYGKKFNNENNRQYSDRLIGLQVTKKSDSFLNINEPS